jgi:hypothetical protein
MKIRSDTDLSKAVAAAGIRAVPRPAEPAAANQGSVARENAPHARAPRREAPSLATVASPVRGTSIDQFERSVDVAADDAAVDRSLAQRRLARQADLARCSPGCATTRSSAPRHRAHGAPLRRRQQRPARCGSAAQLTRVGDQCSTPDADRMLANRTKMTYTRIDAQGRRQPRHDVISIQYAEQRHALPLTSASPRW